MMRENAKEAPMGPRFHKATLEDLLVKTRIRALLAVNRLPEATDMSAVEQASRDYYTTALANGSHAAGVWGGGWRSCWWRKPGSGASPPSLWTPPPWGCRCMNPWASSTCPWRWSCRIPYKYGNGTASRQSRQSVDKAGNLVRREGGVCAGNPGRVPCAI